jgi:hypothetical protein
MDIDESEIIKQGLIIALNTTITSKNVSDKIHGAFRNCVDNQYAGFLLHDLPNYVTECKYRKNDNTYNNRYGDRYSSHMHNVAHYAIQNEFESKWNACVFLNACRPLLIGIYLGQDYYRIVTKHIELVQKMKEESDNLVKREDDDVELLTYDEFRGYPIIREG